MKLELTRKTDLAISALRVLHEAGRRVGARELAKALHTTSTYLPQVMAPLVKRWWVDSQTGPSGGYQAGIDLTTVSTLAVIEAIEGPVDGGTCVLRGGPCGDVEHCSLHMPWTRARAAMVSELDKTSVILER
jgi:Rrf2 family protein